MADELDHYASRDEVVAKYEADKAEHELDRTRAIVKTVRLVAAWLILAGIFIAVLVTGQDPASIKYYAGSLATLGVIITMFIL